jgi:hypothetical protein
MLLFSDNNIYLIRRHCSISCHAAISQPVKEKSQDKPNESGFSFFKDVVPNILPALKNLNYL